MIEVQKIEGWSEKPLEELLLEAQKVYVGRKDEKEKQKAKLMVSTVEHVVKQQMSSREKNTKEVGPWREVERGRIPRISSEAPVGTKCWGTKF